MSKLYIRKNNIGTFYYKDPEMTILHRENGPAIEYADGNKLWYQNGKLHRLDGPAVEFADGSKEYWIGGMELSEQEFLARTQAPTCENKIVTIGGVDYKLTRV